MDDEQQNYGGDSGGYGDSTTAYADDSGGYDNGASAYADVAVNQIYVQPDPLSATDPVILGVEARNGGSVESGPFKVRYTIDNGDTQDFDFPSIQAGGTQYIDWNHAPLPAGNYTFSAMLDVENQIQETNRDDNSAYLGFVVQGTAGADEMDYSGDQPQYGGDGQNPSDDQPEYGNDGQNDSGDQPEYSNEGQKDSGDQPESGGDADAASGELAYEGDMEASVEAEAIA